MSDRRKQGRTKENRYRSVIQKLVALPTIKNELREIRSALWFRPTLFSLVAVSAAVLFGVFDNRLAEFISLAVLPPIEKDTVKTLLKLTAGGMLTMTTVTLSVLMLVLSLAAGQASPRAVPELMADRVTQNALSVFIATFVFSLAALALLEFGMVEDPGTAGIFLLALALMATALKYLVQWIHHVADTMKLNRIVDRIQNQAHSVLKDYFAKASDSDTASRPRGDRNQSAICPKSPGYIQLIDLSELDRLAEDNDVLLDLTIREGDFVHPRAPVMTVWSHDAADRTLKKTLQASVIIGAERSAQGDPLLGFELLAEVACRALSPGINDPQSALICINYLGALLAEAGSIPSSDYPPARSKSGRMTIVRISFNDMLKRAFRPIARDGANFAEVICGLVDVLEGLARTAAAEYLPVIIEEAQRAADHGAKRLLLEHDRETLLSRLSALEAAAHGRSR